MFWVYFPFEGKVTRNAETGERVMTWWLSQARKTACSIIILKLSRNLCKVWLCAQRRFVTVGCWIPFLCNEFFPIHLLSLGCLYSLTFIILFGCTLRLPPWAQGPVETAANVQAGNTPAKTPRSLWARAANAPPSAADAPCTQTL